MKIYAITTGSYSDYHICALTTDEAKAERLAKICSDSHDKAYIEEYDDGELSDRTMGYYDVFQEYDCVDFLGVFDSKKHEEKVSCYSKGKDTEYFCYVCAEDEDHARKKAYDMIAKYKAELAGL